MPLVVSRDLCHRPQLRCQSIHLLTTRRKLGQRYQPVGELEVGAEVTVRGEMSGEAKAADSFWAKVLSKAPRAVGSVEDSYVVENATGVKRTVARSLLRHRVFVKQCHCGVTGDKKHDRYAIYCLSHCSVLF